MIQKSKIEASTVSWGKPQFNTPNEEFNYLEYVKSLHSSHPVELCLDNNCSKRSFKRNPLFVNKIIQISCLKFNKRLKFSLFQRMENIVKIFLSLILYYFSCVLKIYQTLVKGWCGVSKKKSLEKHHHLKIIPFIHYNITCGLTKKK